MQCSFYCYCLPYISHIKILFIWFYLFIFPIQGIIIIRLLLVILFIIRLLVLVIFINRFLVIIILLFILILLMVILVIYNIFHYTIQLFLDHIKYLFCRFWPTNFNIPYILQGILFYILNLLHINFFIILF